MKMNKIVSVAIVFSMIIGFVFITEPSKVLAYSYGHPGEEELAEAYKEFEKHIQVEDWESARLILETYSKEFDLYFQDSLQVIEKAFEEEDQQLALEGYQSALRKNVERRLQYAYEQFDDYAQAKLLLAKARGTFKVLDPIVAEKKDEQVVEEIYIAFEQALAALGNPGLFGVGQVESDIESFEENREFILETIKPLFPVPNIEENDDHLTEEELEEFKVKDFENNPFWLWLSIGLGVFLVSIIFINKKKNKNS